MAVADQAELPTLFTERAWNSILAPETVRVRVRAAPLLVVADHAPPSTRYWYS